MPTACAIAVHEWGAAGDPPLFLVHGGLDFARTFEVFAPKLAAARLPRRRLGSSGPR